MTLQNALAVLVCYAAVSGCAPVEERSDHALQWDKFSARLTILDDRGIPVRPFDGKTVAVPGYLFSGDEIRLHPGKHHIGRYCPQRPGGIVVLDMTPSTSFDFKAGHAYQLKCIGGSPAIRQVGQPSTLPGP